MSLDYLFWCHAAVWSGAFRELLRPSYSYRLVLIGSNLIWALQVNKREYCQVMFFFIFIIDKHFEHWKIVFHISTAHFFPGLLGLTSI